MSHPTTSPPPWQQLRQALQHWALALGFADVGICDIDLGEHRESLKRWLDNGLHGQMGWMAEHGEKRLYPEQLLPGTLRLISVRMDYLPPDTAPIKILKQGEKAYISRYALGKDYHKLMRKRLKKLGEHLQTHYLAMVEDGLFPAIDIQQRPFVDSAPVLEKAVGEKAGLGWIGKHTLLMNRKAGSWFFLGELFTNIPLPVDNKPVANQCGSCSACLKVCPTDAFLAPYVLDARRCISYLTIELKGSIPVMFRQAIGNRVFGCDDCQAICPWNKYAKPSSESAFSPRHRLQDSDLSTLFAWSEAEFLRYTEGSAIRRIGYERWLRNLAVGLGNAPKSAEIVTLLQSRRPECSAMVQAHIDWAIGQQLSDKKRKRKLRR